MKMSKRNQHKLANPKGKPEQSKYASKGPAWRPEQDKRDDRR